MTDDDWRTLLPSIDGDRGAGSLRVPCLACGVLGSAGVAACAILGRGVATLTAADLDRFAQEVAEGDRLALAVPRVLDAEHPTARPARADA